MTDSVRQMEVARKEIVDTILRSQGFPQRYIENDLKMRLKIHPDVTKLALDHLLNEKIVKRSKKGFVSLLQKN